MPTKPTAHELLADALRDVWSGLDEPGPASKAAIEAVDRDLARQCEALKRKLEEVALRESCCLEHGTPIAPTCIHCDEYERDKEAALREDADESRRYPYGRNGEYAA